MNTHIKLLLGLSGSVATIKANELITQLKERIPNLQIKVIVTKNATHFITELPIEIEVYTDEDEWNAW